MSPFVAAFFLHCLCVANGINFTTVYEWDKFDFIWPPASDSSMGPIKDEYRPENVFPLFMAVFEERLLLSLGMDSGIPATLVWLPTRDSDSSSSPPKLAPFLYWKYHKKANCNTIQVAKGMKTDTDGRLWVLDNGSSVCQAKLLIFDLVNNYKTEHAHRFPHKVVSHSHNERWLLDIVLEKTTDDYLAYIVDSESEHIVVYSRETDKSWSVETTGKRWVTLALSPNREARQLYLARLYSNELYSVSVSELKNGGGSAAVKLIGTWTEKPYRMVIDSSNVLYAAFFNQTYLSKWNISEPFREQQCHEVGRLDTNWPFTFALDASNTLWMTERNQSGAGNRFKLLKADVVARSYLISSSTESIPDPVVASTTPQVNVNGKATEVVRSSQTPTSKTGTPRPALQLNETSGGFACLVGDDRKSQSSNTILILLLVSLVLSGIVILWLTLRMRRMQHSFRQIQMGNNGEMYVFPDSNHRN